MRLDFDVTIPANTLEIAPTEQLVSLLKGTLTGIELVFKPGCAHLVQIQIFDELLQVAPANRGGAFNGDNDIIRFSMNYPLVDDPFRLLIRGWSDGTLFPHTIIARFDVEPGDTDDKSALLAMLEILANA